MEADHRAPIIYPDRAQPSSPHLDCPLTKTNTKTQTKTKTMAMAMAIIKTKTIMDGGGHIIWVPLFTQTAGPTPFPHQDHTRGL